MVPLWLQIKYVNLLAYRLERFKQNNRTLWNFRCPFCGDSQRSRAKARGYIYEKKDSLNFTCKNCGAGTTFYAFLKDFDQRLWGEMTLESLSQNRQPLPYFPSAKPEVVPVRTWTKGLRRVSKLAADHQARRYVESRLIPMEHWGLLFHANAYFAWANSITPGRYNSPLDEPRLVIPFQDLEGELTGFQGRAYGEATAKYLTVSLKRGPLVFGLERVNLNELIPVTEGPIDSTFLENGIAAAGGDLITSLAPLPIPIEKFAIVFDNEPRSHDTVHKMKKAVLQGYRVCVWPSHIKEKDVNDMVLARVGVSGNLKQVCANIFKLIVENLHSGIMADIKIGAWRRD